MAEIRINQEKCKGCLLCIGACPKGLIKVSSRLNQKGAKPVEFIDNNQECLGCMMCAVICPDCCIEVYI